MAQEPSVAGRPGAPDASAPAGLLATAERVGHHVWAERQIFSFLGAWSAVPTVAVLPAAVAVFLGEQAARHGWHAEVVLERLPQLRELDAEALVAAPTAPVEVALAEALPAPPATDDPAASADALRGALAGYYRVVLPRLVGSYRALLAGSSEAADASLRRWLGFVVADDVDEWVRGDALLRTITEGDAQLDAVLARQGEVERRLAGCALFPG